MRDARNIVPKITAPFTRLPHFYHFLMCTVREISDDDDLDELNKTILVVFEAFCVTSFNFKSVFDCTLVDSYCKLKEKEMHYSFTDKKVTKSGS